MIAAAHDLGDGVPDSTRLHPDYRPLRLGRGCGRRFGCRLRAWAVHARGERVQFFVEVAQRCLDYGRRRSRARQRFEAVFQPADRIPDRREGLFLTRRRNTRFDLCQPVGYRAQHLAVAFAVRAALLHPFVDVGEGVCGLALRRNGPPLKGCNRLVEKRLGFAFSVECDFPRFPGRAWRLVWLLILSREPLRPFAHRTIAAAPFAERQSSAGAAAALLCLAALTEALKTGGDRLEPRVGVEL